MTKIKINENITIELQLPEVMTINEFQKTAQSVLNTADVSDNETMNHLENMFDHLRNLREVMVQKQIDVEKVAEEIVEKATVKKGKRGRKPKFTQSDIDFIKNAKKDGHKIKVIVQMFNRKNPKKQMSEAMYYYLIKK